LDSDHSEARDADMGKKAHGMQFSLVHFGANATKGQLALGGTGDGVPGPDDDLKPIEIDISEPAERQGAAGFLHSDAEFLIISISGCAPKRKG